MTMSDSAAKITPDMAGTWLDGHVGWANHYRVVDRAVQYGYNLKPEDEATLDAYVAWMRDEFRDPESSLPEAIIGQGGLVDEVTEYLEGLAPRGYHFEWDMGELSLLACDQIEGDSCESWSTDEEMALKIKWPEGKS